MLKVESGRGGGEGAGAGELAGYLAEFSPQEDDLDTHYEEGELEAEWLAATGLSALAAAALGGAAPGEEALAAALRPLPPACAAAAARRVRALARSVRARNHHQRPHVRHLFTHPEGSGASSEGRSRSATPDSLPGDSPPASPPQHNDFSVISGDVRRRTQASGGECRRLRDLFPHSELYWADVASNCEGIELLGYQRYGTVQGPRIGKERINGSILHDSRVFHGATETGAGDGGAGGDEAAQPMSFEHAFSLHSPDPVCSGEWSADAVDVEALGGRAAQRLRARLWLELAALFDAHHAPFLKRKPPKRKRRDEGSVFGVGVETLLRRDLAAWEEPAGAPSILRALVAELSRPARLRTPHLLRRAPNPHATEALVSLVERSWWTARGAVSAALQAAGAHEVAAVLKRLLRSLPPHQPLLTHELLLLFYHTHALGRDMGSALNLLSLAMGAERRGSVRALLRLGALVAQHRAVNHMDLHAVACILAPALFPPGLLIKESDPLESQLATAAHSVRVTEALLCCGERLWSVPPHMLPERAPSPAPQAVPET